MYRNTYLEMYKTASTADSSITLMFAHFTQIYNTLGCVLQDLEYQMGKILLQQQVPPSKSLKEPYQQYHRPKQKVKDKQIIKIEESQAQVSDRVGRQSKEFEMQISQSKQRNMEIIKDKSYSKHQQIGDGLKDMNREGKKLNPRENTEQRVQNYPVQVHRKTIANHAASESFESFFGPKKANRPDLTQKQPQNSSLAHNAYAPQEIPNPVIENTYDDFLDRFFKDDSRKKRS